MNLEFFKLHYIFYFGLIIGHVAILFQFQVNFIALLLLKYIISIPNLAWPKVIFLFFLLALLLDFFQLVHIYD